MKRVFATKNLMEAHLVKDLLQGEGIAAEVHGEWLCTAATGGGIPFTPETWPSVWITKDSQLKRAVKFVAGYEGREKKTTR